MTETTEFQTAKELRDDWHECCDCGARYRSPEPAADCCTEAAITEGGAE